MCRVSRPSMVCHVHGGGPYAHPTSLKSSALGEWLRRSAQSPLRVRIRRGARRSAGLPASRRRCRPRDLTASAARAPEWQYTITRPVAHELGVVPGTRRAGGRLEQSPQDLEGARDVVFPLDRLADVEHDQATRGALLRCRGRCHQLDLRHCLGNHLWVAVLTMISSMPERSIVQALGRGHIALICGVAGRPDADATPSATSRPTSSACSTASPPLETPNLRQVDSVWVAGVCVTRPADRRSPPGHAERVIEHLPRHLQQWQPGQAPRQRQHRCEVAGLEPPRREG